jgi:hypothetical protein
MKALATCSQRGRAYWGPRRLPEGEARWDAAVDTGLNRGGWPVPACYGREQLQVNNGFSVRMTGIMNRYSLSCPASCWMFSSPGGSAVDTRGYFALDSHRERRGGFILPHGGRLHYDV